MLITHLRIRMRGGHGGDGSQNRGHPLVFEPMLHGGVGQRFD
ncbi:hypothetical protein JOD20_005385 [Herpetosiphon giganteus]|nr:hypothetical protein [Herpetosiphon giganteus]